MNNDTNMDTHCDSNKIKHETSNTWVISLPSRVTPTHSQNFFMSPRCPSVAGYLGTKFHLFLFSSPPGCLLNLHSVFRSTSRIEPPIHLNYGPTGISQGSTHQYTSRIDPPVYLKDRSTSTLQRSRQRYALKIYPSLPLKDRSTGTPQGSTHQYTSRMDPPEHLKGPATSQSNSWKRPQHHTQCIRAFMFVTYFELQQQRQLFLLLKSRMLCFPPHHTTPC